MAAERAADWKPEIVSGGFAGHCTNNGNQSKAWVIKSDPDGEVVRARLQKGWLLEIQSWASQTSH